MHVLPDERPIQIEQDIAFQYREWRMERVGWLLIGLVVVAGIAGAAGGYGPLVSADATARDGLRVEYDRFVRQRAPTEIRVIAPAALVRDGTLSVSLATDYLDRLEISSIAPDPERVVRGTTWTTYTFAVAPSTDSLSVVFRIGLVDVGLTHGRAGTPAAPVELEHVVYP